MADTLLTPSVPLASLRTWLEALLPDPVVVYVGEPPASASTPFVILDATIAPQRISLAAHWSLIDLDVEAFSVHNSVVEAQGLAALVRTGFLTGTLPLAGAMDVVPAATPVAERIAGVPQVHESWVITMNRS